MLSIDRAGVAAALATALLVLACHVALANRMPLDFDESYNLQVPLNLYHVGRYQSWYDGRLLFPHQITTGPTVLLPIAAAFIVTGPSYRTARGVMTLFLLAFLWQAYALARQVAGRAGPFAFAGGAMLFILTPTAPWVSSIVLGELPAVVLLLVAIRLLGRAVTRGSAACALAAGLALGLAALAKVVVLICAAGVFAALPLAAELRGRRRSAVWYGAAALAGMAVPLLGWEAIKLAVLGWAGYGENWQRYWRLVQVGGSGLGADAFARMPGIAAHVAALVRTLGWPAWLVATALVLAMTAGALALLRRAQPYALWALALAAAAYWAWWLCFNTTMTLRHLVTGYALTALLLPLLAARVIGTEARHTARNGLVAALTVAAVCLFPPRWPLPRLDGIELAGQKQVARVVQYTHAQDPDSEFWGFGWRQAPEISFLAQLPFRDVTRHTPSLSAHNFLVLSGSSFVGPQTLMRYRNPNCVELIVQAGWSSVCRLRVGAPMAVDTMLHP